MRTQIRLYIARFVGVGLHSDGISMALKSEPRTWLICSLCCVVLLVKHLGFQDLDYAPSSAGRCGQIADFVSLCLHSCSLGRPCAADDTTLVSEAALRRSTVP
mmetsp:Transcript_162505/g.516243  ORF Transcript_162505/g.516243 Transcript_162505/m.516243 type:complete len:103 (+) Transcript_162505:993-1301(+)